MNLSKTDFKDYLKCPKCLWLKKKKPQLYTPPIITETNKKLFREGREVELIARKLFKNGTLLEGKVENLIKETEKFVSQKKSPIFQATFVADNLLVKVDVLEYNPKSSCWDVYEIKSSTRIKTERENNHIKDITFQKIALEKSGIAVGETFIIHLNKDYIKNGKLDINELFTKKNVVNDVEKAYEITAKEITEALSLLSKNNIKLDSCSCIYLTRRNHCSCFSTLNANIPDYSIHDIRNIRFPKLKSLVDSGIFDVVNVSDSFKLTSMQRDQVTVAQTKKVKINSQKIEEEFNNLKYPLYFLDYETLSSAIPILDGLSPHQHIPFQVSIHTLESGGDLKHFECLVTNIDNAMISIVEFLKKTIKTNGSIISWNKSFENDRNKAMAKLYPEHNDFLLGLNERTFDLMPMFARDYIHPDFRGQTTLKKVLSVLVPKLSYAKLNIQEGMAAMENWRKIIFDDISEEEKSKIEKNLLEYCKLDTLAMVEIFKHLN